jgi:hypothetical protein
MNNFSILHLLILKNNFKIKNKLKKIKQIKNETNNRIFSISNSKICLLE